MYLAYEFHKVHLDTTMETFLAEVRADTSEYVTDENLEEDLKTAQKIYEDRRGQNTFVDITEEEPASPAGSDNEHADWG